MPSVVPMAPATMTARKPTTMDTRAPKISRESTSRPTWSVPSRWARLPPSTQAGGLNRSVSVPTSGSEGASTSAKIAVRIRMPRMAIGSTGRLPDLSPDQRPGRGRTSACIAGRARLSLIAYPRIDDGVEHVDHQVDDHDHHAAEQHGGLDHGEVAESYPFIEKPANTRPGEHRLHDHRHIDHDHEIDAGQRQHGDEGVLEGVLGDDQRLRQSLEARELDVLGAQHLEHGRPREPHVGRREVPSQGEGGHEQVEWGPGPRRGQPAEIDGEEENEEEACPEGRQRESEEGKELPRV